MVLLALVGIVLLAVFFIFWGILLIVLNDPDFSEEEKGLVFVLRKLVRDTLSTSGIQALTTFLGMDKHKEKTRAEDKKE